MKHRLDSKRLFLSISLIFALSLAAALIPAARNVSSETLHIGFPFAFFGVHCVNGRFSTHLAIPGIIVDVILAYGFFELLECLKGKFMQLRQK